MLEKIYGITKSEAPSPSLDIIREITRVMKENPNAVLFGDLSDFGVPRITLETIATLDDRVMHLEIVGELKNENIEITIFDARLRPSVPREYSFCYRVNIFGGDKAKNYGGSFGYCTAENIFETVQKDGSPFIVSDHWTETNLTPKEALDLLGRIRSLSLPGYDENERTKAGTPRYTPLSE